jgi:hypothetical protein
LIYYKSKPISGLDNSPTRQGKFSKREGLFQKPLDIFQGKREENIGNRIFFTPM